MRRKPESQWLMLLVVCVAAAYASWWVAVRAMPGLPRLTITFLDVGQGDAIVVRTPSGKTLVVDAGPPSGESSAGMRAVVPFLRSSGIHRLDALLLTHADADHVGGAADVLDRMSPRRLLISPHSRMAEEMRPVLDAAQRRGVRVVSLAGGQRIDFRDGVVVDVLHPRANSPHPKDNDNSLVLRLQFGRTSVLLTGDAETQSEERMVRDGLPVRADILKLGHHGSRTSTTPAFLRAVGPKAAVVSCGRRNSFGHPHRDVTARLAASSIPLFRTDQDGAVTVESDGRNLRIRRAVRK